MPIYLETRRYSRGNQPHATPEKDAAYELSGIRCGLRTVNGGKRSTLKQEVLEEQNRLLCVSYCSGESQKSLEKHCLLVSVRRPNSKTPRETFETFRGVIINYYSGVC